MKHMNSLFKKWALGFIVLLIVLFLINLAHGSSLLREPFYIISSPIEKLLIIAGEKSSDFLGSLFNFRDLALEEKKLASENQKLLSEIAQMKYLKDENETLKAALSLKLQEKFKLLLCEALSWDFQHNTLFISKGSNDGVLENMPLITGNKVLVGKVVHAYRNSSQVQLISSPKAKFDVSPLSIANGGENKFYTLAQGGGENKIILNFYPLNKEVKANDVFVTSCVNKNFPKSLLVGRVENVVKNDINPYQKVIIKPFFKKDMPEFLFLITNFNSL